MFKGILIFLAYCITTIYCSSQNHVSSDLLLLILSAADPSCMLKEQCGPKMNSNNKPYTIFINDPNNSSVQPLSATIYDIIPELRTRTEEDAKEYFTKVLFPSAKKAFNEYFGVSNFNELNLSQQELEEKLVYFQNHLNEKAEMEDIVKGLISSNNENIGYLDDSKDRTLHNFYNDVSNKFSRYVRLNTYNGHGTFYNNNNNNNPTISENLLDAMVIECKQRDTCSRHFNNGNSNIAILEHINTNNEKEYHLIINDKKNERAIHPFTFTEKINNNGQIAYELNHNYYHKEIHYYKNINMDGIKNTVIQNNGGNFNSIHDIFADKLINRARNTNGNTDNLIGDILNVGNLNSHLITSGLNNAIKNTIRNKPYFSYDNLSDIVEDTFKNTIDENQKQRLVTYLSKEFSYDIAKKINDHFYNSHNGPLTTQIVNNFIKDAIKERCEHEKKLYNNENNISSFDSSLINKALDNPASFTDEEKINFENMLKDYTKFDNNPNELTEVINSLGNSQTQISTNTRQKLIAARDHKYFKSNLSLINNFEVSFASNDEQERFVQNKLNNFGRTFKEPLSNSNRGYYKDSEYDLGIKCGITYTDNSASTNKGLYIPQENELDIGDRASFNVAPYSYKDQNTENVDKTKDKMNNNGIQKFIYNESNSPVKLSNLINAITNNQVNTKLSEHLRSINDILKNDQDYLKPNDNKFTNPNHWRDDIIIQNLNNIFEQSYNDFENLDNLCNELDDYINQESNSGSNSFSLTEILIIPLVVLN